MLVKNKPFRKQCKHVTPSWQIETNEYIRIQPGILRIVYIQIKNK